MDLALTILAWIGLVIGALVALVLLTPLHLKARGRVAGLSASGWACARWGWFILRLDLDSRAGARLRLFGLTLTHFEGEAKEEKKAKKEKKEKPRKKGRGGLRHSMRNRRVLWAMARRMLATLHLRGRVHGVVGLDDPADTAYVDLLLAQLRGRWPRFRVDVWTDYADEALELDGEIGSWIVPAQVGLVALWLMLSGRNRRALRPAPEKR